MHHSLVLSQKELRFVMSPLKWVICSFGNLADIVFTGPLTLELPALAFTCLLVMEAALVACSIFSFVSVTFITMTSLSSIFFSISSIFTFLVSSRRVCLSFSVSLRVVVSKH